MEVPPRPTDLPDADLTQNAREVLGRRYLKVNKDQEPIEEPEDMFWRVSYAVASAEKNYGYEEETVRTEARQFYAMLSQGIWVPNSPTLMNAGRELGQLSACFVLPIEDNMESILGTLRDAGLIHKSGGGTGFAFSNLRREGAHISTTAGTSTGPVSFMDLYDKLTDVVKQGGKRRGANMAIMRVDHPDIRKFVHCKEDKDKITNFNISVAATDEFMDKALESETFELVDYEGNKYDEIHAGELLEEIAVNAWNTGEPGLFFIDEANRHNPVPHLGRIQSTNPCGEQCLLPYDVCNLGSLNVGHDKFVSDEGDTPEERVNWETMEAYVWWGVRFLDNVIDVNEYPLEKIRERSDAIRRIGDGVMGFADLLLKLGLPYDSEEGRKFADKLASFLHETRHEASEYLAEERGTFPEWEQSIWGPDDTCARTNDGARIRDRRDLRNANVDTVAPTGTISIIAGCSGGIEPLYSVAFERNQAGTTMVDYHPAVEKYLENPEDMTPAEIREAIEDHPEASDLFQTAHDIAPEDHVRMQAVWQRHIDNSISKTINLPESAPPERVLEVYKLAYQLDCKGITVYRDGSRDGQALSTGSSDEEQTDNLGVCPSCDHDAELVMQEGCKSCPECNWSACSV